MEDILAESQRYNLDLRRMRNVNQHSGTLVNCRVEKRIEIKVIVIVSISDKAINQVVPTGRQKKLGKDNRGYFLGWGLQMVSVFWLIFSHLIGIYNLYYILYPVKEVSF